MSQKDIIKSITEASYPYGFESNIPVDTIPAGLTEHTVRLISQKKQEPRWLLEKRLQALRHVLTLKEPKWAKLSYPPIDYQSMIYYAAPKQKVQLNNLKEADPKLLDTFNRLGIPLQEQKQLVGIATDVVLDSVSITTTFKKTLARLGIIFCSFNEALQNYPELVQTYFGKVVPMTDNYFAALNTAVFSDGSFCYIPKGTHCPMELSTYFRINAMNVGQFERTLIIAEEESYVSYLEGCTAPMRHTNQLHAAVVEIYAKQGAHVKYSTIQNWYPGNKEGEGGVYNFVTKRALCQGAHSKVSWTQVETGSAITWKYPSCILQGDHSTGEFYSVAITKHKQQADTGTKMIHLGAHTKSKIIAKGIAAGHSSNSYRGKVKFNKTAENAYNFSQCDSLLIGNYCNANTFPYIEAHNPTAQIAHEATTSKISKDQLFYCHQRGIDTENAIALIINGYCQEVLQHLPMEFTIEARKLLALTLEDSIG